MVDLTPILTPAIAITVIVTLCITIVGFFLCYYIHGYRKKLKSREIRQKERHETLKTIETNVGELVGGTNVEKCIKQPNSKIKDLPPKYQLICEERTVNEIQRQKYEDMI